MNSFFVLYLISLSICVSFGAHKAIIKHPNEALPFLAIVSSYSSNIGDLHQPSSGKLIYHSSDSEGCTQWQSIPKLENESLKIGVVDRGTCTFLEKTKQAQLAGLDAIFIVSEDESMTAMGADDNELKTMKQSMNNNIILSLMVPHSFKKLCDENIKPDISIEISEYSSKVWDICMIVMIFIATALVGIGAYYSSDTERAKMNGSVGNKSNGLRRRAPIQEINNKMAWSFIIIASIGLLTLYFFVSKIFVIIVIIFCIGATNGLSTIFAHLLDYLVPTLQKKEFKFQALDLEFTLSDLLGFIPAALLSIIWYSVRKSNSFAWILQNIMCVGLLLILQRTIRLTNLKIASILLGTAFFYDIFWVFLSPSFFESSVMVSVATYQHNNNSNDTLPVVLKFPRLNDIFHSPMILGLGDIALPGLLISYLLRYDYNNKIDIIPCMNNIKNGYFLSALIGYLFGMLLTDINLIIMQSGQPALLFIVPCTLGTTAIIAYKRGHFKQIWKGVSVQYTTINSKSNQFLLKS